MRKPVIDKDGYRPNVGIILVKDTGQVLWARRAGERAWQFPQGGIKAEELPKQALYRELREEIGLSQRNVQLVGCTKGWLRYRLPKHMLRHSMPGFVGQKQKWFLLKMLDSDESITFKYSAKPEFDCWRWVSFWYPLSHIVSFKRDVYRRAMKELSAILPRELPSE